MRLLWFLFIAIRAYRRAGEAGSAYAALTINGMPQVACFVATGREAWRVSQRAIEEFELKRVTVL